jgi:hypothetical protein
MPLKIRRHFQDFSREVAVLAFTIWVITSVIALMILLS